METMERPVPKPVVDWTALTQASDPLRKTTRGRYRALLKRGVGSRGFIATPQGGNGRLAGKRTFHSVLAALAVRADRAGDSAGAEYLTAAAARLERRYGARLREYLRWNPPEDLPDADFYANLLRDTSDAVDHWARIDEVLFAAGEVSETGNDSARIVATTTRNGVMIELLLPSSLVETLHRGDAVWVFRNLVGHAAVVDVLPAVPAADFGSPTKESLGDSEDREEEAAAARYAAGPGAKPSREELRKMVEAAESESFPRIDLVG